VTDLATPASATDTLIELAGHTQATLSDVRQLHTEVHERLARAMEPGDLRTLALTATDPVKRDPGSVDSPSLSLGIVNPTGYVLRLGIGGGSPTDAARAFPVPPNAAVVLPIAVGELEVGLDDVTAVGSDTVVIYVLRFNVVQPFYLHRY
jgi:hypothetical protein